MNSIPFLANKTRKEFQLFQIPIPLSDSIPSNAGILTYPSAPSSFGAWLNHAGNQHTSDLLFVISDGFLFMGVAALNFMQISQVGRNITTNEMANSMRYSYLRGPGGRFRNPYDHGCKKNCWDLFINGYNEVIELYQQVAQLEEINMMPMTRSLDQQNGNGIAHSIDVDKNSKSHTDHHVHSSSCGHGKSKNESGPLGLVLGLGLGRNSRAMGS